MTRLAVVSAGLGVPSSTRLLADRLTAAAVAHLGDGTAVRVVELRDHAHDLADHLLTGFAAPPLQAALEDVVTADALVAVTPVFSASYSGLFKTFFDVVDKDALTGMPVLMGATAGTSRHALVLEHAVRPLMAYLRAVPVPTAVFAGPEDWGASGLSSRIDRAAQELAALVTGRPRPAAPSGFVPFAQLLSDVSPRS